MTETNILLIILLATLLFLFFKVRKKKRLEERNGYDYRRNHDQGSKSETETITSSRSYNVRPRFNSEAVSWCSSFLGVPPTVLSKILKHTPTYYDTHFSIRKRSGGYRVISAPGKQLQEIQRAIYRKILFHVHIHPAATGFRPEISIINNARIHLGNKIVLKTDIHDFFGSISQQKVRKAFETIGYPYHVSKVMAHLCCFRQTLPQGASTSPALSNIIAGSMDSKLEEMSQRYGLNYSRYADDMVFSSHDLDPKQILPLVDRIVREEGYKLNRNKTRFLGIKKRKIITGISVSSGTKLTIPKAKKREIRQNVYFILKYGLKEHQKRIGSKDPVYMKRLLGYLCFWLSVEPDNAYVSKSLMALRKLER